MHEQSQWSDLARRINRCSVSKFLACVSSDVRTAAVQPQEASSPASPCVLLHCLLYSHCLSFLLSPFPVDFLLPFAPKESFYRK